METKMFLDLLRRGVRHALHTRAHTQGEWMRVNFFVFVYVNLTHPKNVDYQTVHSRWFRNHHFIHVLILDSLRHLHRSQVRVHHVQLLRILSEHGPHVGRTHV